MSQHSFSKSKIKVVLLEGIHQRAQQQFSDAGYENVMHDSSSLKGQDLDEALGDAHILGIRSRTQLTQALLDKAPKLMAVGCFCIGTNQVDLNHSASLGIPVFNSPFSNTRSVAELMLAQMILLLRRIPEKSHFAHLGTWQKSADQAHETRGKTLGIIGYGRIGSQLSVLAEALGMQVVFYDTEPKLSMGNAKPVQTLKELLTMSDVVSLHVPQTPQTQWMIGKQELALMKPGSILMNASRGKVVQIEALADALSCGHLKGAAVDVFPKEPKSNQERFESPLCGMPNVILTPHIGGSTLEAQEQIGVDVANKLIRYSDNGSTLGAVNFPQVVLPVYEDVIRIIHIHHNQPGVMHEINAICSKSNFNVAAQYLQTKGPLGYVVMDVASDKSLCLDVHKALTNIEGTLRSRVLYG